MEDNLPIMLEETKLDSNWLSSALERVARGERQDLLTYLHTVGDSHTVQNNRATVRSHWVPLDTHGRVRMSALAERLVEEILDYCIPRTRIESALEHLDRTGSSSRLLRLEREARSLFVSQENSGEGGELLLYTLLETGLGIPQILCKMPLKTSNEMHIHGVDGVHASSNDAGDLAVYWGEAKVYATFESAMAACFNSVTPFLTDDGSGALRQDMLLARRNIDMLDPALSTALIRFFDNDHPEAQRLEMRAACLIGFGMANYANPFESDGTVTPATKELLAKWHTSIESRVASLGIDSFEIEVFCVPFPTSDSFRVAIQDALKA